MKAREFLAQKNVDFTLRNLVKEPLTEAELRSLAKKIAGGMRELVAPKRRAEAEAIADADLPAWLAADGGRLRRPIIDVRGKVSLGFTTAEKTFDDIIRF